MSSSDDVDDTITAFMRRCVASTCNWAKRKAGYSSGPMTAGSSVGSDIEVKPVSTDHSCVATWSCCFARTAARELHWLAVAPNLGRNLGGRAFETSILCSC